MTYALPKSLAAIASVVVLGSMLQGCGGSAHEQGAVGTAGADGGGLSVATTSAGVSVENTSGAPLFDVQVTINPVAGTTAYTRLVTTLDTGERRDVPLTEFKSRDGAALNRMFVVPKNVVVTAAGAGGKKHEVTVRWQ